MCLFMTLNMLVHSFLASKVSDEKCDYPVDGSFYIFSLLSRFSVFGFFLICVSGWISLSSLYLEFIELFGCLHLCFIKYIWEAFGHYVFRYSLCPFLDCSSGTHIMCILVFLMVSLYWWYPLGPLCSVHFSTIFFLSVSQILNFHCHIFKVTVSFFFPLKSVL